MRRLSKVLTVLVLLMFIGFQAFACTIFAVGKDATVDGSTMISHTCDSRGDDVRLWLIPSMEAGTERDIVLNGRAGADYSQFPEVKDYGIGGMVLGTYTHEKDTHQYIHGMYSFMNDAGLAMGESTCGYDSSTPNGQILKDVWGRTEGILDCYMIQDLALEVCSTALEAVEFMGSMIDQYGWNGAAECINITDGTDTWVLEAYGGHVWAAVRVPDNAVFVAANRCRISYIDFEDSENYRYSENIQSFALENGLWDGVEPFEPCNIYAPNKSATGCTLREWRAMSNLDKDLELDPYGDPDDWPMFVIPDEKVSVQTIKNLCSDYYQGTEFDISRTVNAGPFGDVLHPNYVYRPTNMYNTTYFQIANVKSWLPEEARCLVWVGWGAPSVNYITPVFASQTSFPSQFGQGLRAEPYNQDSAWWVSVGVQQTARINYESAIEDVRAVRDPKLESVYEQTAVIQEVAGEMIENGQRDEAVAMLTAFANSTANDWHKTYIDLDAYLRSKYMFGCTDMKVQTDPQWWTDIVNENLDNPRPEA